MKKKPFTPSLNTPADLYCKEERNKAAQQGLAGSSLYENFRDFKTADIAWESDMIAKSAGIHLEFDRAIKNAEKDWFYMIRMINPGGGALNRGQWRLLDDLSEKYSRNPYGLPTLRITTRQTFQFHWIQKEGVLAIVRTLAENGFHTLNACGDNVPNVTACPLSRFSPVFNATDWARRINAHFQLPLEPFLKIFAIDPNLIRTPKTSFAYGPNLLNRKFKIGIAGVHHDEQGRSIPDNCVEMRTHDLGVAPILHDGTVEEFQIYVGGGQAERNGKPSAAVLSRPLTRVNGKNLLETLDAVVRVHQRWGDRQNRHWSRLKYVIRAKGVEWYRAQVTAELGRTLALPVADHDCGARHLHHGWNPQPGTGHSAFGAFIENGRLCDDSPNGRLKSMVRDIMDNFDTTLSTTPNQDLLFADIPNNQRAAFEDRLSQYGYGTRDGRPYSVLRRHSGACVGLNSCRIAYTDAENLEPELLDDLERRGWGDLRESIGITGCEAQCFRPATKSIGLIGFGWNRYQVKLFGSESARHQGIPLVSADGRHMYLQSVEREKLADVIDALFQCHKQDGRPDEDLGAFHRRMGADAIIRHLKHHPLTAELMTKTYTTECLLD